MTSSAIISKVWYFCNTLRDDGVRYGDYLDQLTYPLFLKMADEYSRPPYNRKLTINLTSQLPCACLNIGARGIIAPNCKKGRVFTGVL